MTTTQSHCLNCNSMFENTAELEIPCRSCSILTLAHLEVKKYLNDNSFEMATISMMNDCDEDNFDLTIHLKADCSCLNNLHSRIVRNCSNCN